jgi:hypothetical protein
MRAESEVESGVGGWYLGHRCPGGPGHHPKAGATEAAEERALVLSYVAKHMREGTDYGVIPGAGTTKVLLKPGAEKLVELFRCTPKFTLLTNEERWEGNGFFNYMFRARIVSRDAKEVLAEGYGSSNSHEENTAGATQTGNVLARQRGHHPGQGRVWRRVALFQKEGWVWGEVRRSRPHHHQPGGREGGEHRRCRPGKHRPEDGQEKGAGRRGNCARQVFDMFTQDIEDFVPEDTAPAREEPQATAPQRPGPSRALSLPR